MTTATQQIMRVDHYQVLQAEWSAQPSRRGQAPEPKRCQRLLRSSVLSLLMVLATTAVDGQDQAITAATTQFQVHRLRADSEFSACAVFDVNRDGKTDIFCGDTWFEGPNWKPHHVREVEQIRGRFDDYSNLPLDVDGDGWTDVISVNYRSQSLYWVRNPGSAAAEWTRHVIATPGSSETGRLVDMNGDGRLDVLPNGTKFSGWYERTSVGRVEPEQVQWKSHDLPPLLAGHGIGAGDVDGDGLVDLVNPQGWFRQRQQDGQTTWEGHPEFQLHRDAGLPILVHDVDGDGDADLIWGRGHDVGVYWLEQDRDSDGVRSWSRHAIDTSWSCCHSLLLGDIDGDGRSELVVGKRFLGHDGKDQDETDPLVIASYKFLPKRRSWNRSIIVTGEPVAMDLDPKLADVDDDGDLDIVCPSRCGLSWCENRGTAPQTKTRHLFPDPPAGIDHTDLSMLRTSSEKPSTPITSPLGWGVRRWQILAGLEQAMGRFPEPSERVPLQVEVVAEQDTPHYLRRTLTYVADASGDRVSAHLLIPHDIEQPRPAMLCLHPTSRHGKDLVAGIAKGDDVRPNRNYGHELAVRGYVCLIPDYPGFGTYRYDHTSHRDRYQSGSMKAIWNNVRGVDLLESLPEVDADRIGCIGHSLGGHNALFTAVFDSRLRVVATSCGFTEFHQYYEGRLQGWTSPTYMPRIRDVYGNDPDRVPFDFQEVVAAIAPRGVFIAAPLHDSNFEVAGVRAVERAARPVFERFSAGDRLVANSPDCGHDFPPETRQACYKQIDRWFKFAPVD